MEDDSGSAIRTRKSVLMKLQSDFASAGHQGFRVKASRRNARAENLSDGLVSTALALPDASGTTYRNSPPRRTIGQTRAKRLGWIRILAGGKAATSAKKLQKI